MLRLGLAVLVFLVAVTAFSIEPPTRARWSNPLFSCQHRGAVTLPKSKPNVPQSVKQALAGMTVAGMLFGDLGANSVSAKDVSQPQQVQQQVQVEQQQQQQQQQSAGLLRGFQTKSGLKYFDIVDGTIGESPRYGDLVSFFYTCYYKPSAESSLDFIDSNKRPFLHKHGNGRVVRGIDEALHTMRVGGKRRIIVPKSIGYNEFGLGPLPEDGGRRRKLGDLIDLLDKDQGELIFDIELVMVAEDENDQGYYDDDAVSQDELRQLVLKSLQSNTAEFLESLKKETPPPLFKK